MLLKHQITKLSEKKKKKLNCYISDTKVIWAKQFAQTELELELCDIELN